VFIGGHIIEIAPTNEGEGYFDRTDCYQQRVRGASPLGESNPNLYPEDTIMTEEELRTLIGNLAVSTASNTESIRELRISSESQAESIRELRISSESQAESIRELRISSESQAESIRELRVTVERQSQRSEEQSRSTAEALASLQASSESQLRSIESMRESIEAIRESTTYNTDMVASALALAAEALKISANTSKNLDRLEADIADLKQIVGIVIRDSQADRVRFSKLEEQD
jgi:hypothetical protein